MERTRICTLALALGRPHLFFWSSVLASILPSVKWGYKVRRWDIYLTSSYEIHTPCSAQQSRVSVFITISNILTASIFLNRTWGKLFFSYWHSVAIVHLLSHVRLCNPMDYSTPGSPSVTVSWSLPKLVSVESVMPFKHLMLCHSLLLPSIFPCIRTGL